MESRTDNAQQPATKSSPVATSTQAPGATIGMVGGGQLGRMFAVAAAAMGYRVVIFTDAENSPASHVAAQTIVGDLNDPESEISKRIASYPTVEIRADLGLDTGVRYRNI